MTPRPTGGPAGIDRRPGREVRASRVDRRPGREIRASRRRDAGTAGALLLPLGFLLPGCDLSSGPVTTERVPTVLELELEPEILEMGESGQARVRVLDQHGNPFDRFPPWVDLALESSDPAVLSVDGADRYVAESSGSARITVRTPGLLAQGLIGVNPSEMVYTVDAVYINQSAQDYDGSVPLVAGRDGYLRVFLKGDRENFFRPDIRVRLYRNDAYLETLTLSPISYGIPEQIDEDVFEGSWGSPIAGSLIQPGLEAVVESDPAGVVPLLADAPVHFPADGGRHTFDVRELPSFRLTLVPVYQGGVAASSALSPFNYREYVEPLLRMFPIGESDIQVREPFNSSYEASSHGDWIGMLQELRALQVAEASDRYYYGLTRRAGGNILGIGYVGSPAAMGYDELPGADTTLAHELGHNFGQWHAPCGGPAPGSLDSDYPHGDGRTGSTGIDVALQEIRPSDLADVMSYCRPRWIGEYMYRRTLEFREQQEPRRFPEASGSAGTALLVWGSVQDGRVELSPTFEVETHPLLPSGEGEYRIEARDRTGAVLLDLAFDPEPISHAGPGDAGFAFALPADLLPPGNVHEIRVRGPRGDAHQRATMEARERVLLDGMPPARRGERLASEVLAEEVADGVRVRWDATRHPMAMIRDARTGHIVGFARGGETTLPGVREEVRLDLSHGVGSHAARVPVRRRP